MYRLCTLGGFWLERDRVPLDRMAAHRKALALLAIVAAQGSTSRDRLMALLWPDADDRRAKSSLKQAIHLLRRQLEAPDLFLGTRELRLNPARITSDVSLFTTAVSQGNAEEAVRHYGGPFLDGMHLDRSAEFERWAEVRRAELARQYMEALERLARAADDRGDPAAAAAWWRRLQVADPLNSRVALSLMLALDRAGDRAAALQHAHTHATLVQEELGIAPEPAVQELATQLRRGAVPRAREAAAGAGVYEEPATAGNGADVDDAPGADLIAAVGGLRPNRGRPRRLGLALVGVAVVAVAAAAAVGVNGRGTASRSDGPSPPAPWDASLPGFGLGSIAVLPFLDLSPGGEGEYFSDGLTEELITALSQVRGLKVAARTSAFQFKSTRPDIRQISERLRVAHVLEGSVRTDGDRLRISVQLVSARDGYQLWAQSYDGQLSDVFAVQEDISRAIVEALQETLGTGSAPSIHVAVPTASMAAYERYLKGLHLFNRLQIPSAIENLEAAVTLDPQFARAYSALAEAYAVPAAYSQASPAENQSLGIAAAESALRIDPDLADAHAALGWLQLIGFRWDEAGRALRRAVELDPAAPRTRLYYAMYLHRRDMPDDALSQLGVARELDPLSLPITAMRGSVLAELGQVEEGMRGLHAALELDSAFPLAHALLGHIHLGEGRTDEAITHYEQAFASVPSSYYAGFLGHAYARDGRTADARRILATLRGREESGDYVSLGAIGWILLGLGERADAFRYLDASARRRDVFLTIYGVLSNRHLSGVFREDPGFRRLRGQVGLTP